MRIKFGRTDKGDEIKKTVETRRRNWPYIKRWNGGKMFLKPMAIPDTQHTAGQVPMGAESQEWDG